MISEKKFKKFIELLVHNFNARSYDFFTNNFAENAELICPEVNTLWAKTPKLHCIGRDNIIAFWGNLSKITNPEITQFEHLKCEEVNRARFYYHQINLVMNVDLHFNHEEKLKKMEFTIVS